VPLLVKKVFSEKIKKIIKKSFSEKNKKIIKKNIFLGGNFLKC
jgi:hypothetical protein